MFHIHGIAVLLFALYDDESTHLGVGKFVVLDSRESRQRGVVIGHCIDRACCVGPSWFSKENGENLDIY